MIWVCVGNWARYNEDMDFHELAQVFAQIEATSLRNEKTRILAELYARLSAQEASAVSYLVMGRVTPLYDPTEFGIAAKQAIRAVALALGLTPADIEAQYKQRGDLGEVVAEGQEHSKQKLETSLSVMEVYQELKTIAEDGGSGSQERKAQRLARLLTRLDAQSGKYVVRLVTGKSRLGFSDLTILDALSVAKTGDKRDRAALEYAFNVWSDMGMVAEVYESEGLGAITTLDVTPGRPVKPMRAERLGTVPEIVAKLGSFAIEPKFDGMRCIGGYTGIFVRERGYVTVRELRVGDHVLTHTGNFRPVLARVSRPRRTGERVFALQTFLGDSIKISEGHPVLVRRGERLEWLPVENITNEWLYYPKPRQSVDSFPIPQTLVLQNNAGYTKTIQYSKEFFQFLGYWVGDGISNNSHESERVGIVCNAQHSDLIARYEAIIHDELKIRNVGRDQRNGAVVLYFRDPELRRWLCTHFRGKGESGKRIPEWFFGIHTWQWEAFLQGWREADGTTRHSDGFRITTKERTLAMMGQLLSAMHGRLAGVRRERIEARKGSRKKTYYQLIFPGTQHHVRRFADGYLVKIKRLEQLKRGLNRRLKLYDIQIEGDESFCVSVGTLHNCQIHAWEEETRNKKQEVRSKMQAGLFGEEQELVQVKIFSRGLEDITHQFPEVVEAARTLQARVGDFVLDGEAIGVNPETGAFLPFQETIKRKRKHEVNHASETIPLKVYVFDVLYAEKVGQLRSPYTVRRVVLTRILGDGRVDLRSKIQDSRENIFVLAESHVVATVDEASELFDQYMDEKLEGILCKKLDSVYRAGARDFNWVKYKRAHEAALVDTVDAVVMGYYVGRGKRNKFGMGAFLVGIISNSEFTIQNENVDGKILTVAKIGTGITDEMFGELYGVLTQLKTEQPDPAYVVEKNMEPDVWVAPHMIVEVQADEITKSPTHTAGYALRFPRLIKVRSDKQVADITTQGEVTRMFEMQGGREEGRETRN